MPLTISAGLRRGQAGRSVPPDVDRAWGRLDDVAVEVTPEKRRSWCGATLHEETQRELSMPYGEIWLEG